MDDPKKTGRQDRAQVNVHEDYEVQHIAEKFGVSPAKVKQAEQQVGKSRRKFEEFLMSRKERQHACPMRCTAHAVGRGVWLQAREKNS